jgi:hypothetical protein
MEGYAAYFCFSSFRRSPAPTIYALGSGDAADVDKTRPSVRRRVSFSGTGIDGRKSWEDVNGSAKVRLLMTPGGVSAR